MVKLQTMKKKSASLKIKVLKLLKQMSAYGGIVKGRHRGWLLQFKSFKPMEELDKQNRKKF